jgi:hypothetical protein
MGGGGPEYSQLEGRQAGKFFPQPLLKLLHQQFSSSDRDAGGGEGRLPRDQMCRSPESKNFQKLG